MDRLVGVLLDGVGAQAPTAEPNEQVEVVRRGDTVFVINHSAEEQSVTVHGHGRRTLAPTGPRCCPAERGPVQGPPVRGRPPGCGVRATPHARRFTNGGRRPAARPCRRPAPAGRPRHRRSRHAA
ncbi:Beta-galactosidase C-terminal domain [Streptomyces zhihengii]